MRLGKNYFFNLSVTVGNVLFPLLTLPIILRVLGPEKFGEAQYILSLSIYFSVFAAVGVPIYGISQVAKAVDSESTNKVCSELIFIQLLTGIFSFIAFFVIIFLISDVDNRFLLAGITSPIILASFLNVDWYFTGIQDFKTIAKRAFVIKVISAVFILFLPFSKIPIIYYISIITFTYVGNYAANYYIFLQKQRIVRKNLEFRKHLPHLISIQFTLLAGMIYTTLDSVFIGVYSSVEEIGFYNVGSKIVKLINPVIVSFGGILIPKIAFESLKENKDHMKNVLGFSYDFIIYFSIPVSISLLLLSTEIIQLFGGERYMKSIHIINILSALPFIIGLGHLFSYQILIPLNKSIGTSVAAIIGALIFIITGFILIPKYGALGCAIAVLITEFFVTLIYFIFLPKIYYSVFNIKPIIQAILSSIVFLPIYYFLSGLNINYIILIVINSTLYVVAYISIQHMLFKNKLITRAFTEIINWK